MLQAVLRLSPFWRVILGLVLGILVGLFFGEHAGKLDILGEAYIRLLQMTVIPYILVSLANGLGRLDLDMAKRIGIMGGSLILIIWALSQVTNLFLPLAYPDWTTASLFSTSALETAKPFDPLTLYIPANPFYSMANTIVPAIVVFAILFGLALIVVPGKDNFMASLDVISKALMRIASFVGKTAPIGIFAIAAAAAGTLQVEELSKLQVYLWAYVGGWMVITFWTLPALVAWTTPLTYREVLREARTPMVTAFATGTVLVVLPMIVERCQEILSRHKIEGDERDAVINVLVPTAYSFPSAGTLLGLGFIMFGAWYVGSPLGFGEYLSYTVMGALVAFGSMAVAIPFLLDFFSLPADLFQLYLLGSVVTARFATALAAMHGVVVSILGVFAVMGLLRLRDLFKVTAISIGVAGLAATVLGFILTAAIPYKYAGDDIYISREPVFESDSVRVIKDPQPLASSDLERSRLDIIQERGSIRVGYFPDRLPFSYKNKSGDVVGLENDLMRKLSRDLDVKLDIVRLEPDKAIDALNDGRIDVLTDFVVTPLRASRVTFTNPYMSATLGFVVPDHRREEFASYAQMRNMTSLHILVPGVEYYAGEIKQYFPNARVEIIDSMRPYFRGQENENAVLAMAAETGSAWSLIYPDFTVAVPKGLKIKGPVSLTLPRHSREYLDFMNTWLDLTEKNGTTAKLYDYWIEGKDSKKREPRWSIMRNVLGWEE